MPTHETCRQRGVRRGRILLLRVGEELRQARLESGLSLRNVGLAASVSHTQVVRVERGLASHVDVEVLSRLAAVVGSELSLAVYPAGSPVRDAGHLRLLARLRARLPTSVAWSAEVAIPVAGDLRSADAVIEGPGLRALVEAETRLGDIQALQRRMAAKSRDLAIGRQILLVSDSRHNRAVISTVPGLTQHFPIATRAGLIALGRGHDPGGDCLIVL